MVGEPAVGEDPGVDPRVKGLDAAVEHLREAGHGRDIGHRQARLPQRSGRAASGDELEPGIHQPAAELDEARLVRDREQRPAGRRVGSSGSRAAPAGLGEEPGDGRGQEAVLDGLDPLVEARFVVAGKDRDGFLGEDRPAVEDVASTRWTVAPVTRTPAARASRTAWAPGNEGSSEGCVLTIRPANASRTSGPTIRMYPARTTRSGRAAASRSASAASSPPSTTAVSIPCSAAQSIAGQARSANDEDDVGAELAAAGGRVKRSEVRPRARDRHGDPTVHPTPTSA